MRLKEMISDQRSFDFLTNSSCYYQAKDIEKSMGEYGYTDVKTPMYSEITSWNILQIHALYISGQEHFPPL